MRPIRDQESIGAGVISPSAMRETIAQTLQVESDCVSIKAKTGEGLDAVGRGEAVMVEAVVLLQQS